MEKCVEVKMSEALITSESMTPGISLTSTKCQHPDFDHQIFAKQFRFPAMAMAHPRRPFTRVVCFGLLLWTPTVLPWSWSFPSRLPRRAAEMPTAPTATEESLLPELLELAEKGGNQLEERLEEVFGQVSPDVAWMHFVSKFQMFENGLMGCFEMIMDGFH